MTVALHRGDALLIVDVQHDFLPGGALGIARGDEIVERLNRYLALAVDRGVPVYASRDWHPADHCSFKAQGGPWPVHCVAGTRGAAFDPALELPAAAVVIDKGTRSNAEAYSVFAGTDFEQRLRAGGVRRLLIGGLATDYCVRYTTLDARAAGFDVVVLGDAVRGVDATPGDSAGALREMKDAGAAVIGIEDVQA